MIQELFGRTLSVTNHLYTPYIWVANARFLAGLSPENRTAVATAARAGILASRKFAAASTAMETLSGLMKIHRPSDAELQAFRERSQPAMKNFIFDTLGAEGLSLLDAFRANGPTSMQR
jgi:TRAP-type C4-dicarboxylate transport system substrate-binding protein